MNLLTGIQETIREYRQKKRCNSPLLPRREIWVSRETSHVPVTTPTRSISSRSRVSSRHYKRSQLPLELWPEPIAQGFIAPIIPRGEGYDSDEENKRNGISISYSLGQCRPFQKSMKQDIEAEFMRLQQHSEGLSAMLRGWERRYMDGRRLYFKTRGLDWTEPQWAQFLFIEKSFFDVQDELFAVQDKMESINAQMYLCMENIGPSLNRGVWLREKDTTLWSLEGAGEQRAMAGEYPVLEWRGVDYNATERTDEHHEDCSSLA